MQISEEIEIYADLSMIESVFRNLISNAIKFTDADCKIGIPSETMDEFVNISIINNGTAMNSETIKRFQQHQALSSSAGTNNESGIGIGLAICRDFIYLNNGLIQISNRSDKSTAVCVSIPAYKTEVFL